MPTRQQICGIVSKKLTSAAPLLKRKRAVIGMDGFVDLIIDVVDKRAKFSEYNRVDTIAQMGQKIVAAAGKSANFELVVKKRKLGGNGPIYADALAIAGMDIDYIGSLGLPSADPVFADFGKRARLFSICESGFTDALEFSDGKLMLGKITQLSGVNWHSLIKHVGIERFVAMCERADLIAMNNWTMLPELGDIWKHVLADVLPLLTKRDRMIFIDLADPAKRSQADLLAALATLSQMQQFANVTLGLNLQESTLVAQALNVPPASDDPVQIQKTASAIREKMAIACVIVHPLGGAGAADADGTAWLDGPYVRQPNLSTGAGDNFNAGFCLGRMAGCNLSESLCCGVSTSGYYVRNAASPTAIDLAKFVANLPSPEA